MTKLTKTSSSVILAALSLVTTSFAWEPTADSTLTEWSEAVTPENAWTEYPRPSLVRENWTNLNGLWKFAITKDSQKQTPTSWEGEILVPFCIESALSGIKQRLAAGEAL